MLMLFCSDKKNLVASILKSKCPLTLIMTMYKWSNVLNKYGSKSWAIAIAISGVLVVSSM